MTTIIIMGTLILAIAVIDYLRDQFPPRGVDKDVYCRKCGEKGSTWNEHTWSVFSTQTNISSGCTSCGFREGNIPKMEEYRYNRMTGEKLSAAEIDFYS